uniref:Uncharacterized protein n=1 Tax=Arundo donax TaxID=35708 RepID=A0A0A8Z3W1_ARUDO
MQPSGLALGPGPRQPHHSPGTEEAQNRGGLGRTRQAAHGASSARLPIAFPLAARTWGALLPFCRSQVTPLIG